MEVSMQISKKSEASHPIKYKINSKKERLFSQNIPKVPLEKRIPFCYNRVMNLEDLVTDALQIEEEIVPEDFLGLLDRSPPALEVLHEGRKAEELLLSGEEDPALLRRNVVPVAIGYLKVTDRRFNTYRSVSTGVRMLVQFLDWTDRPSQDKLGELHRYLRDSNNRLELSVLLSTSDRKINFLQDMWGEDTADKMAAFTGARMPTVRKWLGGANPSDRNASIFGHLVTIAYRMHVDRGSSYEEVALWLEEPLSALGGKSVLQVFATTKNFWSIPEPVRTMCREMNLEI